MKIKNSQYIDYQSFINYETNIVPLLNKFLSKCLFSNGTIFIFDQIQLLIDDLLINFKTSLNKF